MKEKQQVIDNDARFRKLIENSYEGIILIDKDLNTLYRSPSAERITGWNMINRTDSLFAIIHPEEVPKMKIIYREVMADPDLHRECCFRFKHFNGHYIWLDCIFTNMLSEPNIGAIVCNFRDVSDKKQAEELLQHTLLELLAYKYALDKSSIVGITDQKGIIKHVNDNFCKISQYSREELIGQDHRIVNSGYHSKAYIKNLWTTIANGKVWNGEFRNKAKDGSYYWVDATVVPFLDSKGKPYQYIAIRSDITELKKTVIALEQSQEKYSEIFHLSPLPMWVFDSHSLKFLDVNIAAIKHYGYSMAEFLSMTIRDIRPKEEVPVLKKALADFHKNQTTFRHGIFIHQKKNGETIKVEIQSNTIEYNGTSAEIVLANDMTEKLNYVKAIEDQNEQLHTISWMQSHVIRAPLTRLMGLIDLFKSDCNEKDLITDYMLVTANELDDVIKNITELSIVKKLEK
jgi:PAS domain S-box-containing protein